MPDNIGFHLERKKHFQSAALVNIVSFVSDHLLFSSNVKPQEIRLVGLLTDSMQFRASFLCFIPQSLPQPR